MPRGIVVGFLGGPMWVTFDALQHLGEVSVICLVWSMWVVLCLVRAVLEHRFRYLFEAFEARTCCFRCLGAMTLTWYSAVP